MPCAVEPCYDFAAKCHFVIPYVRPEYRGMAGCATWVAMGIIAGHIGGNAPRSSNDQDKDNQYLRIQRVNIGDGIRPVDCIQHWQRDFGIQPVADFRTVIRGLGIFGQTVGVFRVTVFLRDVRNYWIGAMGVI